MTIKKILGYSKKDSKLFFKILTSRGITKTIDHETAAGLYLYNPKIEKQIIQILQKELSSEDKKHVITKLNLPKTITVNNSIMNPEIIDLNPEKEGSIVLNILLWKLVEQKFLAADKTTWEKFCNPQIEKISGYKVTNNKMDIDLTFNNKMTVKLETDVIYSCLNKKTRQKLDDYCSLHQEHFERT